MGAGVRSASQLCQSQVGGLSSAVTRRALTGSSVRHDLAGRSRVRCGKSAFFAQSFRSAGPPVSRHNHYPAMQA